MMLLKSVQDYKSFIGVLRRTAREDIAVLLGMWLIMGYPVSNIVY